MYSIQYRITPSGKWRNTKIESPISSLGNISNTGKMVQLTQRYAKKHGTTANNIAIRIVDDRDGHVAFNYKSVNETTPNYARPFPSTTPKLLPGINTVQQSLSPVIKSVKAKVLARLKNNEVINNEIS